MSEHRKAYTEFNKAIKSGDLVRPEVCEECGEKPTRTLHGHHDDYDKPLEVRWLCNVCHRRFHNNLNAANGVRRPRRIKPPKREGGMSVPKSIRICLVKHNMSVGQLGKGMGLTKNQISRLINGHTSPDTSRIDKLATLFKMSSSDFIRLGE